MHAGTKLSSRQLVRALGATAGLGLAFLFAGVAMADSGTGATATPTTTPAATAVVQQAAPAPKTAPTTQSTTPTNTSNATNTTAKAPATTTVNNTQTAGPSTTHSTSGTTPTSATSQSGSATAVSGTAPQQTASETNASGTAGNASNVNVGSCNSCHSGSQSASDSVDNTTTQTIVQVAPSTAVATAINYGPGSASATAVANPTQIASQTADPTVNDPATNVGHGDQSASNTTDNTTTQYIDQEAPTTATATATSYNGHASATAVAAPTQIATQYANTSVYGSANNVGLGCSSCHSGDQSADNTTTNTTTQTITQSAPVTATATATSGSEYGCPCDGNSGDATAIAIAKPVQIAAQSSTDRVRGSANNTGFGSSDQDATNTTTNDTNQNIDQSAETDATATATNNPYGFNNHQSATAVAIAQPSQLAVEGALNVVSGSANNYALGFGCDCLFGHGTQTAENTTTNFTNQQITQNGDSDATATATNNAFGLGNHQFSTAIAVAAPKQSASDLSSAYVSGIATNVGLGRGTDQFAFNVTTNAGGESNGYPTQYIDQEAPSSATADAENSVFGFGNSQSASATALADPNQSAGERSSFKLAGQAINTNLGSTCSYCDLFGHGEQDAYNTIYSDNAYNQNITQTAPATATAYAYNNGFGFELGGLENCGCGNFGHFSVGSTQNATAVAAAAPVQRASETMSYNVSGSATNVILGGHGPSYQGNEYDYGNYIEVSPYQSITQDAPTSAYADAENNPESTGFGFNNHQSATAIAVANPQQSANIAFAGNVSGNATNIYSGSSCGHSCGCEFCGFGNDNSQYADNYVYSEPDQEITQSAPADVTAYAYNYPSTSFPWFWNGCGSCFGNHGLGSVQSATAIAAANPIQSANIVAQSSTNGSAINTWLGNTCSICDLFGDGAQYAYNETETEPEQTISQDAPVSVTAGAANYGFGLGGLQQATAIAVAAPRQSANEIERDYTSGSATNLNLGHLGDGYQEADNYTYNYPTQTIDQDAPATVQAYANNEPSISVWDECGECGFFGFAAPQNATAIAGAAPVQTANEIQSNNSAKGSASNLNLGNLGNGYQYADNTVENDDSQDIDQDAPAYVDAVADNFGQPFFPGCSFCSTGAQNATAIATATPVQHGNLNSKSGVQGHATNINLAHSGWCGWCDGVSQDATDSAYNSADQDLTQETYADSEAYATNYPSNTFPWFWGGCGESCGCGSCFGGNNWNWTPNWNCGACDSGISYGMPSLVSFHNNAAYVPSFSAPSFSTPLAVNGLSGLGNWGSSNLNFVGGQGLGIKLGLNIGNSESLHLPTISQLLHGVSLFGLLHGVVTVSLNLSVTTPWVQVATAVAHATPFSVLFSVSQLQGLGPWYGYLL